MAQSPVSISPDTLHVHFDTTGAVHGWYMNDHNLQMFDNDFNFSVSNKGRKTVRLPGNSPYKLDPDTLRPGNSGHLSLDAHHNRDALREAPFFEFSNAGTKERLQHITFLYGDTPVIKTITCNYSYGPSRFVLIDKVVHIMDSAVAKQVQQNGGYSMIFTNEIIVQNISSAQLGAPERGQAYNDWGSKLEFRGMQTVDPGKRGTITINLAMATRTWFDVYGSLIFPVSHSNRYEILFIEYKSGYIRPSQ